jgi:predicted Kef-type K+ transport protein
MMNKKGQITIETVILTFISMIVISVLMPTIMNFVGLGQNSADPTTSVLLGLLPTMLVIAIIIGVVKSRQRTYPQQFYPEY